MRQAMMLGCQGLPLILLQIQAFQFGRLPFEAVTFFVEFIGLLKRSCQLAFCRLPALPVLL
ncbi:MAG TPA: hypothetical protein DEB15_05235, partial [Pusillimonas sp.]|nr:hypothetical protein [Pusillimonas sp.]